MRKNAASFAGTGRCAFSTQGVKAAPSTMWRELMSQVVMKMTRSEGAALQSATAANSLPPAKLSPAIIAMPAPESPC